MRYGPSTAAVEAMLDQARTFDADTWSRMDAAASKAFGAGKDYWKRTARDSAFEQLLQGICDAGLRPAFDALWEDMVAEPWGYAGWGRWGAHDALSGTLLAHRIDDVLTIADYDALVAPWRAVHGCARSQTYLAMVRSWAHRPDTLWEVVDAIVTSPQEPA